MYSPHALKNDRDCDWDTGSDITESKNEVENERKINKWIRRKKISKKNKKYLRKIS